MFAQVMLVLLLSTAPSQGQSPFSLEGQLLVAQPQVKDPNFVHAVVLVIKHNDRGAFGVVVNRPMRRLPLGVLQQLLGQDPVEGARDVTLHMGGPVDLDAITILHSSEYRSAATVAITDDLSVTGSAQVIDDMAHGRGPRRVMLSMGYAGWAPGLLETEIASGTWVAIPMDADLVFAEDKDQVWAVARGRLGIVL